VTNNKSTSVFIPKSKLIGVSHDLEVSHANPEISITWLSIVPIYNIDSSVITQKE
jgi:hypothetical protein